jgi:two-component system CheB/CheR fusion protein
MFGLFEIHFPHGGIALCDTSAPGLLDPEPKRSDVYHSEREGDATTTVFVVDHDSAIRGEISHLLLDQGYQVELFADAWSFLVGVRAGSRGCLLADASMSGMNDIELIGRLRDRGCELPFIAMSGSATVPMTVQAMKAGAVDFIEKPFHRDDLLASIKQALAQEKGTNRLSTLRKAAERRVAALTIRQHQILNLVLAGSPSKIIAADLGISQRTVDNHRAAIMRKTGSKSIPELMHTAFFADCRMCRQITN